jgi:hypothetical protein
VLYWRAKEALNKPVTKLTGALDTLPTIEIPGIEDQGPQRAMRMKSTIVQYLVAIKAEKKKGQPPGGELERVAQTHIKALQKKSEQ